MSRNSGGWVVWCIGPVFIALAAWLAFAGPKADIPRGDVHLVPRESIRPGAFRTALADPTKAVVGGQQRPCSECHRLFAPANEQPRAMVQHKDVVMHHGMNTRCLNCHDGADRDKLVLHNGELVSFLEAPRLCSQCHGTVYRDWQKGMHGKTMGSWDASSGHLERLRCVECHDPHSPAYTPMEPLPGPNTMRMGDQTRHEEPAKKHAPLRRYSTPQQHENAPAPSQEPSSEAPAAPATTPSKEGTP